MLRAAASIEALGIPTASIVGERFLKQAQVVIQGLGVPLALGVYPGAPMADSEGKLQSKVEAALAPAITRALTHNAVAATKAATEVPAEDVIFSGGFDAVQDYCYDHMWSDGLPVVPPTPERVARFIACTQRDARDVVGIVPQEGREASILSIAVNGVMAGCRPEYMPVLVAVIEAMCDPQFRLESCGSTPGWEPLVIASGPIAKRLDFNFGQGMMRVGRRANSSIGRFVRLYLRNICGYRIPPGAGDQASIGQSFLVAMAEDEDATHAIGWPSLAEERGFARSEDVVTVQSVVAISSPIYSTGTRAQDHVRQWAEIMEKSFAYWSHAGFKAGAWYPLIVAGPSVARVIAKEWTKDEVRRYLHDHMRIAAERISHYARQTSYVPFSLEALVANNTLPEQYASSSDPQRLLPMIIAPEMVQIVVAGDPDRNQSRAYMSNQVEGLPTSRRVHSL